MDFGLSSEQELLKDTVRRYLAERCPTTRVRSVMESATGHDTDFWRGLAELGVTGLTVPAEHGGAGLELLDLALAAEELGYAAAPGPFLGNAMATVALVEGGITGPAADWLARIAAGDAVGTAAIGETDSQWDPRCFTTKVADGKLTGTKPLVPYAAIADFLVVAASGPDGLGLWLVERGAPGLEITTLNVVDMTRRVDLVRFQETPAIAIGGASALQRTLDAGLVLVAADAFGGSRRCLEMAVDYAKTREQFGQIIGAFQAVKHQLADMATEIEPCMALWWYAAHAFDRIRDQSERHAVLCKAHLADVFDYIARYSTELHGGIGFTWEFDLHLWFRRSIYDRGYLGDSSYLRSRAAELAGW